MVLLVFIFQSCEGFDPRDEPFAGECEWDENNQVSFTNLQLRYPSGLSNFHLLQIPIDKIDRSLINVLEVNGNSGLPSQARISVNLKADGNTCTGEKSVSYSQGANEVSISTIKIPFVSNTIFFGEVTVGIRGDTFNNTHGNGAFYHIMWSESGNNPNGGIDGNVLGTKVAYTNRDGTSKKAVISKDGCYYDNGIRVCM